MDALVIADAKAFVRASDRQKLLAATEETIGEQLKIMTEKAKGLARDKARIEKEQAKLKEAVLKSLMGEGDYSAALLNEMPAAITNENGQDTALSYTNSGVNRCPQATVTTARIIKPS